jgi:flavin-dependent dehydrogenase
MLFRHAGESGAKIFDGVKVNSVEFVEGHAGNVQKDSDLPDIGRPVSATWSQNDGTSGTINFGYLVDASGRAGIVSTKYMKNRKYNKGLKNIANWAYWEGAEPYGVGTPQEGQPYFEALDGKNLCKSISLRDTYEFQMRVDGSGVSLSITTSGPWVSS